MRMTARNIVGDIAFPTIFCKSTVNLIKSIFACANQIYLIISPLKAGTQQLCGVFRKADCIMNLVNRNNDYFE